MPITSDMNLPPPQEHQPHTTTCTTATQTPYTVKCSVATQTPPISQKSNSRSQTTRTIHTTQANSSPAEVTSETTELKNH